MQGRKTNKKVKIVTIVFSIIILMALAVYFFWPYIFLTRAERLNVAGYCVKENRYLTDQEKLDIVAWNIGNLSKFIIWPSLPNNLFRM